MKDPVFELHNDAEQLKEINSVGLKYPLDDDYDDIDMLKDRLQALTLGNNKSTVAKKEFIDENDDKELQRHWMIPFLKKSLVDMLNMFCIKIGIASQFTIDKKGNVIQKDRVTHDCSQSLASGKSVNL
ncbi:hypothetical protein CTEN210_13593 [Chaetoceros tenuissimus]|uniref:Uncharacterized protein n=1 Tax=Chaetoceros tenuissimus TaxID=426638 RepID=A0AAD3D3B4_9STRA|nr:hypothetical protein CTEN210_13593 [Chaetoceros tenuissimus]